MPRLSAFFRNLFRRDHVERDLDDELRAYVELAADENRHAGLLEPAARRAALVDLGGIEQVKEHVRAARAGGFVEQLSQDLSYAFRVLRKYRGFTVVAVITLALGIGATTAVFSIVDTVIIRPLPYADPERLVRVCGMDTRTQHCSDDLSLREFETVSQLDIFERLAADDGMGVTAVGADGSKENLGVGLVTPNWLSTLGVRPIAGRDFAADEGLPGRDRVVILTDVYWKRRFGASHDAIGSTLTFDGAPHTIVGVLPPNALRHYADVVKPLITQAYTDRSLDLVGRLRPGVSLAHGETGVSAIDRQSSAPSSAMNSGRRLAAVPLGRSYAEVTRRATDGLLVMLGAVGLLLLIACANVANLLLSRASARGRESLVRAALGASRGRLVRQALVESTLLFAIGGAAGVLVARLLVDSLTVLAISGGYVPERMTVTLDARILGAAMAVSLFTGLAFGLIPAIQSARVDVSGGLRAAAASTTADRRRGRARRVLIVSEVALSLVLLAGFGLLVRSLARIYASGSGFDPCDVIVTASDGGRSFREAMVFWRGSLERARALPGVSSAALTSRPPANGVRGKLFDIDGRPHTPDGAPYGDDVLVSEDYFETMRIPLLKGRAFTPGDNESGAPVVIISESLARRYFGGEDPIGRSIRMRETLPMTCCATPGPVDGIWRRIVGVVGDVRQVNIDGAPSATVYRPYGQIVEHDMFLVLRAASQADASRLTRELRAHLIAVDRARDWIDARPMWQMIRDSGSIRLRRFVLTLLGTFAALAVLLAAVGIFGVASSAVTERTREIGVRIALGATRLDVFRQIVGEMSALAAVGGIVGIAAALGLTRTIQAMLFGVSPADVVTYVGVALIVAGAVLAASWIPARRATRIDPLVALRHE
jgi:putative ABC transport system permease protein